MTGLAIDTLRYAKRLRAAGFSEEQAEVQAEALSEAIRDSLVTKLDLNEAVEKIRAEIHDLRTEADKANHDLRTEADKSNHDLRSGIEKSNHDLRSEIEKSANSLRIDIRDLHSGLIRWLIPLMLGQLAAMVALVKLL